MSNPLTPEMLETARRLARQRAAAFVSGIPTGAHHNAFVEWSSSLNLSDYTRLSSIVSNNHLGFDWDHPVIPDSDRDKLRHEYYSTYSRAIFWHELIRLKFLTRFTHKSPRKYLNHLRHSLLQIFERY